MIFLKFQLLKTNDANKDVLIVTFFFLHQARFFRILGSMIILLLFVSLLRVLQLFAQ